VVAGKGGVLSVDTHDLKPILTEVRIVKTVNEAAKTIASFARNRLRAWLKCPWSCERGMQNIRFGIVGDAESFSAPQTQVWNK
jgi:hypothetical protein